MPGTWRISKNLIYSLILNLQFDYLAITIDEERNLLGHYRGEIFEIHSKPLLSEWTQIIASFGNFQAKQSNDNALGSSIVVNGKEESYILKSFDADFPLPSHATAEMTIGTTPDAAKSFKGSIGLVEIFTPGAVPQTSKYHLVIYV